MKKNGFIATSILYSFFLIFLTLFVGLVANYLHNRVLLATIEETSRELLSGINNTKITDLYVGDHIKFKSDDHLLNSDAVWTLAKIETIGSNKKLYFISDLNAQKLDIFYKRPEDRITKIHSMTVNLYELLSTRDTNGVIAYDNSITYGGFHVELVTSSFLNNLRTTLPDGMVKEAIFNPGGSYLVKIDNNASSAGIYRVGSYYEVKKYTLYQGPQQSLLNKYCGGTFNGTNINYNANNTFGYINLVDVSVSNDARYVDYCYYASPIAYTHPKSEVVVDIDVSKPFGDEISSKLSNLYNFRLVASRSFNVSSENTYIAGGKGTVLDPYIFTNGVKQS